MIKSESASTLVFKSTEKPPENYLKLVEDDLLTTFKLKPGSLQYHLLKFLFRKPFFHMAEFLTQLDDHLAHTDVASMALLTVDRLASGLIMHDQPKIPAAGPVLVVANHSGWIDSFVALAGITRPDVYLLAGSHPTLENLPHFKEHLILVDPKAVTNRAAAIRQVIEHLKAGHVVVIFPKGLLEPDPALMPGAESSILEWNDSIGIFLNKVPQTVLQPMLISQMVNPKAWDHWAIKLFREQRRRQQFAIMLQFARLLRKKSGSKWKVQPRVDFGEVLSAYDLSPTLNPREISLHLKKQMLSLLARVYPNQP
ncbi:MAG TPA: 1-acyl-sn-glycerol-3-phosphate acyltransferase [Anaerolineaceae bacterium]|nr:1-acyl-sn-glycerol-3-phosphate acyltransferase [Anaerolineaceae bacterium]